MNTAILGIVALVVLALVGWAIAEAKYKTISYTELGIKDVIKTISTKGFSAV